MFHAPYFEGLVARLGADTAQAQAAFQRARTEMAQKVAETPDDPIRLVVLGLIDAALGRKADAIAGGERAVQLLRLAQDHFEEPYVGALLAAIYANTGEKDKALDLLGGMVNQPSGPSYGCLRLHPQWDPLRGDPRFEALVSKAAPPPVCKAYIPAVRSMGME